MRRKFVTLLAIGALLTLVLLVWFRTRAKPNSYLVVDDHFIVQDSFEASNTNASPINNRHITPGATNSPRHGVLPISLVHMQASHTNTSLHYIATTRATSPSTSTVTPSTRVSVPATQTRQTSLITGHNLSHKTIRPTIRAPASQRNSQLFTRQNQADKIGTLFRSLTPSGPSSPIPLMGDYNCSDRHCTEFLTETDWSHTSCNLLPGKERFPGKCHFMNGTNRQIAFLLSFPGSGNTWVRGLLEQATGICTGSLQCDKSLKGGGLNGENLKSGTVIVTKTHNSLLPHSGILLVRNPLDAYVADWNRQLTQGSHTRQLTQRSFGTNPSWNRFVHGYSQSPWVSYFEWLLKGIRAGHPVLVVKYEDLKSDKITQMKRMLDFLKVPYSDEALEKRMDQDYEKFHRPHSSGSDYDHFTTEQREHLNGLVREAVNLLKVNNNGTTYGKEDYLQ